MFNLDRNQAKEMQISNDAFFYILEDEEPLDEDNLEEAQEILALFPNGFEVADDWKYVENTDLIQCTFIPYIEDTADYDEYHELTKYTQEQIKWLDSNHVRLWWFNNETGIRSLKGDFEVTSNKFGHKCFCPGGKSVCFLKAFKKKE